MRSPNEAHTFVSLSTTQNRLADKRRQSTVLRVGVFMGELGGQKLSRIYAQLLCSRLIVTKKGLRQLVPVWGDVIVIFSNFIDLVWHQQLAN